MISQWLVYLWGISDKVVGACGGIAFVCFFFGIGGKIAYSDTTEEKVPAWTTILIIVGIICTIVALFMPDKETLLTMQVSKLITADNYNWTVDQVKGLIDYIIESVNKMGVK